MEGIADPTHSVFVFNHRLGVNDCDLSYYSYDNYINYCNNYDIHNNMN